MILGKVERLKNLWNIFSLARNLIRVMVLPLRMSEMIVVQISWIAWFTSEVSRVIVVVCIAVTGWALIVSVVLCMAVSGEVVRALIVSSGKVVIIVRITRTGWALIPSTSLFLLESSSSVRTKSTCNLFWIFIFVFPHVWKQKNKKHTITKRKPCELELNTHQVGLMQIRKEQRVELNKSSLLNEFRAILSTTDTFS